MIIGLIVFVIVFDVLILALLWTSMKRGANSIELLEDLTEERQAIKIIKEQMVSEIEAGRADQNRVVKKVLQIAAEIEKDTDSVKNKENSHLEELLNEFTSKLDEPMLELTRKQNLVQNMLRKLDTEKTQLLKAIQKAEKLSKFFHNEIPYEDLMKDIELKKYEDARKLLTKGFASEEIATELGMRLSEVELLQGLATGSL